MDNKVYELMNLIYNVQCEKEKEENIIKKSKAKVDELSLQIDNYKAELLSLITDDDPIENDNKVAVRRHTPNVGYTDESKVIKWLKDNFNGKMVKTKITESLDKVPLKKALQTDTVLQEGLKEYMVNTVTDYVIVTDKDNYQKMLEHIKEGK